MVCVAKDVDEDWPIEIYNHDGVASNVTLDVGDMLLFESHSILHGTCLVCVWCGGIALLYDLCVALIFSLLIQ